MNVLNDIDTVFIRTIGERTTDACANRFKKAGFNIVLINKSPFWKALKKVYELGSQCKKPWIAVCDADILPYMDKVIGFKSDTSNPVINTMSDDWILSGKPRQGGIKFYRTDMLKAFSHKINQNTRRPEKYIIKAYVKIDKITLGTHDKEQWYRDVFRKVCHHQFKHPKYITQAKPYWIKKLHEHDDFKVALAALNNIKEFKYLDAKSFPDVTPLLSRLGLKEKRDYQE